MIDAAFTKLIEQFPEMDIQNMRTLIRNARREKEEFEVITTLPAVVISPESKIKPSLDSDLIALTLKRGLSMREFNLLNKPAIQVLKTSKNEIELIDNTNSIEKKSDKKRTLILVAVFIFLIVLLIHSNLELSLFQQLLQLT